MAACLGLPQPRTKLLDCLAAARPAGRWFLPAPLREVSGLALTADGQLFLHNDERGEIAEYDWRAGRLIRAFRLGATPPREDFEGIAAAPGRLYLVTSDGVLFETREGTHLAAVPFTVIPTGVGRSCEVEGLAYEPGEAALLLLCKTPRRKALQGQVTVFRWSVGGRRLLEPDGVGFRFGREDFRGSALERDPSTGHYLALSAINRAVVELAPDGRVLGFARLGGTHPQPEGLAIARDGTVLIADEGVRGPGTLTVYACGR